MNITFSPKQIKICHQKLVRDAVAFRPELLGLSPAPDPIPAIGTSRVRRVSRDLAWKVIARYEWLGTLPFFCSDYFGLFLDDYCAGVACFAVGNLGAGGFSVPVMMGVPQSDIAYLVRGACVHWAPTGCAPRLINHSSRMTDAQMAIAYSDTDAGEIGPVYQASGWTCFGQGKSLIEWVSPKGKVYNNMVLRRQRLQYGGTVSQWSKKLLDNGWTQQRSNPKWRYGLLLPKGKANSDLRAKFAALEVAYPKRVLLVGGSIATSD